MHGLFVAITLHLIGFSQGHLQWSDFKEDNIPPLDQVFPNISRKDVIRGLSPHGYR